MVPFDIPNVPALCNNGVSKTGPSSSPERMEDR